MDIFYIQSRPRNRYSLSFETVPQVRVILTLSLCKDQYRKYAILNGCQTDFNVFHDSVITNAKELQSPKASSSSVRAVSTTTSHTRLRETATPKPIKIFFCLCSSYAALSLSLFILFRTFLKIVDTMNICFKINAFWEIPLSLPSVVSFKSSKGFLPSITFVICVEFRCQLKARLSTSIEFWLLFYSASGRFVHLVRNV